MSGDKHFRLEARPLAIGMACLFCEHCEVSEIDDLERKHHELLRHILTIHRGARTNLHGSEVELLREQIRVEFLYTRDEVAAFKEAWSGFVERNRLNLK